MWILRQPRQRLVAALFVVGAFLVSVVVVLPHFAGAVSQAPTTPPAGSQLCNAGPDASLLTGPSSAPAGAVTIPAGDNDPTYDQSFSLSPNTTYYFATGTHTLGTSQYGQITPHNGDTFIGAPGAVINGEGVNQSAFDGSATDVTIENLTIENFFGADGQMVVNHDGGASWTIQDDTITDNGGAGVGLGTDDVVSHNCLSDNDEYGFSSFGGSTDVTLTDNEISQNDTKGTYDEGAFTTSYSVTSDVATVTTEAPLRTAVGSQIQVGYNGAALSDGALNGTRTITSIPTPNSFTFAVTAPDVATTSDTVGQVADADAVCGCSGGGKFWDTAGGTVTGNYVHDNGFVGIWDDTDNSGFNISDNYIANNWAEGIIYEISYNASITDNTFVDNAWGGGPSPALGGFPDPALYISESGSDSRVPGAYGSTFAVSGNVFTDNWGGVDTTSCTPPSQTLSVLCE